MEYPEGDKGKCLTCGFLSKHPIAGASLPAPRFYEIEPHERVSANYVQMFMHRPDMAAHGYVQTELACFVQAFYLMANLRHMPRSNGQDQESLSRAAVEVVGSDKHCSAWYSYTPGFSPREHYEQLEMKRIENERREFELKLFELGQGAQRTSIQIAQDSKAIVADLKAIAEKNDTFSRRVTVWVILLAVLQVIGALVALPSISWLQRLWHHFFG